MRHQRTRRSGGGIAMRGCTAKSQLRSCVFLCSWLVMSPIFAEALPRSPASGPRGRRWPSRGAGYADKVAGPPVPVDRILTREDYFLASPSITKLKDGRLMVMYEKFGAGVSANSTRDKVYPDKLVSISSNRGKGWVPAGTVGPMLWPTVFSTDSGVYAMGVERQYNAVNNMVVSRMISVGKDGDGKPSTQWTHPRPVTEGLSMVTANGGIDISNGIVTKAVELVPAKGSEAGKPSAALLKQLDLDFSGALLQMKHTGLKPQLSSVVAEVDSIDGFLEASMVTATGSGGSSAHPLFFRLSGINTDKALLVLEPQLINLALHPGPVVLQPGSRVAIAGAPSAKMYGATDWHEAVLQAPAAADLTDPSAWVLSEPVANPAGLETRGMMRLLGAGLSGSKFVARGMLGGEVWAAARAAVESGNITEKEYRLFSSDLVSPFFMEGTPVRLQDSRGGDKSLLILMRVNNDQNCNLGALVYAEDGQPKSPSKGKHNRKSSAAAASTGAQQPQLSPPQARFLRYTFAPGISISHPSIIYDAVSDAYWYVNNVPRDSRRNWNAPLGGGAKKGLQGSPGNSCMVDRSSLGLFYSGNAEDWIFAGMVDYNRRFLFHFTYPNMIVDGNDLLVVSRATIDDFAPDLYRNHNSNAIVMHRVRSFRR